MSGGSQSHLKKIIEERSAMFAEKKVSLLEKLQGN